MNTSSPNTSPHVLQWLPAQGVPAQLFVLLHGVGSSAANMAPLAQWLQAQFPQAAILAPDGFDAFDYDPSGQARQWFSLKEVTEDNRPARIAAVLPRLMAWLTEAQQHFGIDPQATALVGFSQGAILSMALVHEHDGAAGRVLAFAGRYAKLPDTAPQLTTFHLFHGSADATIPVQHARAAIERLAALGGDATIDIVQDAGHEINGALLNNALFRLRSHIPQRTWRAALGAAQAQNATDPDLH